MRILRRVTLPLPARRVRTPDGRLAYAEAGTGDAVLLLHQTPRSRREYEAVLPLLASAGFRAIAMDTPGFGDSDPPGPGTASIERYAHAAGALLDALDAAPAAVVGHHTGGLVAFELAVRRPRLVRALVLSSTPYADAGFRAERARGALPDREPFYPADRPDLLDAYRTDAGRASGEGGHSAVAAYEVEGKAERLRCPVLVVAAPCDPFAYPHAERWRAALRDARVVEIPGGTIPLPDHKPAEFAAAVTGFLKGDGDGAHE